MAKRYLIINADDLGSCHAANEAIEQLFNHGFLTTTTLMCPAPWALDALQRALKNSRMHVGLHITTTGEYENYRWRPVDTSCKTLVDKQDFLYTTAAENLAHASAEDMRREIFAQYEWMAQKGLTPTHADSHMGTVYGLQGPSHLEAVFALCAEKGLNFRLPKTAEAFVANPSAPLREMAAMAAGQAAQLGIGLPDGLFTHDHDLAPSDTYESFKTEYLGMLERAPEGVSELFMHPCIGTPEIRAINPHWQKRVWEFELLHDDEVLRFIQNQGFVLTTYRDAPFFV